MGGLPQFSHKPVKEIDPSRFKMDKKQAAKYNKREQRINAALQERRNDRSSIM